VVGKRHAPAIVPTGKTRYPLYRRLGGLQSRSGQVRKISPPPGFDPRTVQPEASRYTVWFNDSYLIRIYAFKDSYNFDQLYLRHSVFCVHVKLDQNA
jgi:hypothetical protein